MVLDETVRRRRARRVRALRSGRPFRGPCIDAFHHLVRTRLLVYMTYEVELAALTENDAAVGIDMGVSDRLTLSDGKTVRRQRKPNQQLARAQRRLVRFRDGSHRLRKSRVVMASRQHREPVCSRNDCYWTTTDLVRWLGLLVVEDHRIRNMMASAKGTLEKPGTKIRQLEGLWNFGLGAWGGIPQSRPSWYKVVHQGARMWR